MELFTSTIVITEQTSENARANALDHREDRLVARGSCCHRRYINYFIFQVSIMTIIVIEAHINICVSELQGTD